MTLKSPADFYTETLARSEIQPNVTEPIEKVAERLGVTVEVAKLAARYFEQLQLDGVSYPTEEDRRDDALKLATKYVAYRDSELKKAATIADDAMVSLLRAAAAFLNEKKVAGVTASGVLRMAALQLDSLDETTKGAAWTPEKAPATHALLSTTEPAKIASVVPELAAWAGREQLLTPGAGAIALLEA